MQNRVTLFVSAIIAAIVCLPTVISAQWSTDPSANDTISVASSDQDMPVIASDGNGGAIIAWSDLRNGEWDVYAQRINAGGIVQWTTDGIAVCTATNNGSRTNVAIVSDGAGGAIMTWEDRRTPANSLDIYAQRIDGSGTSLWTGNGVAICTASNDQVRPALASDGAGGAIITWSDYRNGSVYNIYAQRVNASGAVQWDANGVAICSASGDWTNPCITSEGTSGAIIAWQGGAWNGYRYLSNVCAQMVNGSGAAQWTANGICVCPDSVPIQGSKVGSVITSDGSGGAIVAWNDSRSTNPGTYAQRIAANGSLQWPGGVGMGLHYSLGSEKLISDGTGGALITWRCQYAWPYYQIYAQHISGSGSKQWNSGDVPVADQVNGNQSNQQMTTDSAGGCIVAWEDYRNGNDKDIYAQHLSSTGAVLWSTGGIPVSTGKAGGGWTEPQELPVIVSDEVGGAIITWRDYRGESNWDVYAQRVDSSGHLSGDFALAVSLVSFSASVENSKVTLYWKTATELDNYGFEIERRAVNSDQVSATNWKKIGFVQGNGTSNFPKSYSYTDASVSSGTYAYRLKQMDNDGTFRYTDEAEVIFGVPASFALGQNYPNPFNPSTTIQYTLPAQSRVRLQVYNTLGQIVADLVNGEQASGWNQIVWNPNIASGLYFYRLEAVSVTDPGKRFVDVKKMILLK